MPAPRAILFDLDMTLLDRGACMEAYLTHSLAQLRLPPTLHAAYRSRFHELDQQGYASKEALFSGLIREFALKHTTEQMVHDFREHYVSVAHYFPDVHATLENLRSRGLRLGIVTNGTVQAQQGKLECGQIEPLVDAVLISEAEGLKKPAQALFERAAARLGVMPLECVFVGDHPINDVLGAARAGMRTAWIAHGRAWTLEAVQPDYVLSSVTEVLELLPEGLRRADLDRPRA